MGMMRAFSALRVSSCRHERQLPIGSSAGPDVARSLGCNPVNALPHPSVAFFCPDFCSLSEGPRRRQHSAAGRARRLAERRLAPYLGCSRSCSCPCPPLSRFPSPFCNGCQTAASRPPRRVRHQTAGQRVRMAQGSASSGRPTAGAPAGWTPVGRRWRWLVSRPCTTSTRAWAHLRHRWGATRCARKVRRRRRNPLRQTSNDPKAITSYGFSQSQAFIERYCCL